ncbi:MAG: DUF6497 family protein [Paracoccaceae bacterium]
MAELTRIEAASPVFEPGDGRTIEVPSGQEMRLQEVVWNAPGPDGAAVRFRFVAPAIARDGGGVSFEAAATDMLHLCQTLALPRIAEAAEMQGQIIISLADREVAFGASDPQATQYFEAYRVENGSCIWEAF